MFFSFLKPSENILSQCQNKKRGSSSPTNPNSPMEPGRQHARCGQHQLARPGGKNLGAGSEGGGGGGVLYLAVPNLWSQVPARWSQVGPRGLAPGLGWFHTVASKGGPITTPKQVVLPQFPPCTLRQARKFGNLEGRPSCLRTHGRWSGRFGSRVGRERKLRNESCFLILQGCWMLFC